MRGFTLTRIELSTFCFYDKCTRWSYRCIILTHIFIALQMLQRSEIGYEAQITHDTFEVTENVMRTFQFYRLGILAVRWQLQPRL